MKSPTLPPMTKTYFMGRYFYRKIFTPLAVGLYLLLPNIIFVFGENDIRQEQVETYREWCENFSIKISSHKIGFGHWRQSRRFHPACKTAYAKGRNNYVCG